MYPFPTRQILTLLCIASVFAACDSEVAAPEVEAAPGRSRIKQVVTFAMKSTDTLFSWRYDFTYDQRNHIMRYVEDSKPFFTRFGYEFEYDSLNRLIRIDSRRMAASYEASIAGETGTHLSLTYAPSGRSALAVKSVKCACTSPLGNVPLDPLDSIRYEFNADNQLVKEQIRTLLWSSPNVTYVYTYENGNVSRIEKFNGQPAYSSRAEVITYEYDTALNPFYGKIGDLLIQDLVRYNFRQLYSKNNVVKETREVYYSADVLSDISVKTYINSYDAQGRLIKVKPNPLAPSTGRYPSSAANGLSIRYEAY